MKKSRLKKIFLICGNIVFIVIILFISFREHSVKPQKMVYIGVCTFRIRSENKIQDETLIKKISNSEDIDLRLESYDFVTNQEIESKLIELAQKQYDLICVLDYSDQELIEKIKEIYPMVTFVFIDDPENKGLLYRQINLFLSGINVSKDK